MSPHLDIDSEKKFEEINRKILRDRARKLAEIPVETKTNTIEVLMFTLANETYAFETANVREVFKAAELTTLPSTPDFLLGIINVRGEILSVIDIKTFFNLSSDDNLKALSVIILQSGLRVLGIATDEILGVFDISKHNLQASLPTLDANKHNYLKGISGDRVIILDAINILNDNNLIINDEI